MTSSIPPLALQLGGATAGFSISDLLRFDKLLTVASILFLTWLIIRYLGKLLDFLSGTSSRARFVIKWTEPVIRVVLWFGAVLLSLEIVTEGGDAFFAGLASLGLAFGLGAQDLVKNIIGGLVILSDRPFQLGDRVKIGEAYGEIDYIGLRSTRLTTPDDTRVTIPNAAVVNSHVFNANSGVPDCQVVTDLFLPITTDPHAALQVGYEAAHTSPFLLSKKPVVVLVSDVWDQSPYLRLRIKAYVYDHRFEPRMQSDVTARAKAEFLRRGMLADWAAGGTMASRQGVA